MPSIQDVYNIREEWQVAADKREAALQKRHAKIIETYNSHTKELEPLNIRDHVAVQNQNGNHPNRWDKTGVVVERLPHRQYKIRMDGSGRVSLRNRKFLKNILPVCSDPKLMRSYPLTNENDKPLQQDSIVKVKPLLTEPVTEYNPKNNGENLDTNTENTNVAEIGEPIEPSLSNDQTDNVRRSTRNKVPRVLFRAHHHGKSHTYEPSQNH